MYQFLIRILAPIVVLLTAIDAIKRRGGIPYLKQRLGFGYRSLPEFEFDTWIHCASVGEVNASLPIIKALKNRSGLKHVIVTTNTPTGKQFLKQHFPELAHAYCPLDWPYAINQFLKTYRPKHLWILETEIWPNLYRLAEHRDIPITLINGRLSHKTLKAPSFVLKEYRSALRRVQQILAKSDADSKAFIQLGADAEKVTCAGNLKYAQLNALQHFEAPVTRDYSLLASSHEDEELKIAKLWQETQQKTLLVIAPRHPKRAKQILSQLKPLNLKVAVDSNKDPITAQTEVFLLDRIGSLPAFLEHAQLVIMGGSFIPKGGHNIIEPCAYGKAVIVGPFMANFQEEFDLLLAKNGLIQCADYSRLEQKLSELSYDAQQLKRIGNNAKAFTHSQKHILETYLKHLSIETDKT